jgi:lysophospholipase L1-like esterase
MGGSVAGALLVLCDPLAAQEKSLMNHIVLFGDSIFDNAAYVAGGPDVVRQLRDILPSGWQATLNALDGAVLADIDQQLHRLPPRASHLVVSIGGNDALGEAGLLDQKVSSIAEALELITRVRERFRSAYARMLDRLLALRLPVAICTIYEPRYPEAIRRRLAATALTALNDAITREAFTRKIDCIDLRVLCDDDADFQSHRALNTWWRQDSPRHPQLGRIRPFSVIPRDCQPGPLTSLRKSSAPRERQA